MDTTFSISFALPLRISVETGFFIDYSVFPKICKNDFRKQQQQSLIHLFSAVHIFREGHKNMMKSANFFDVTSYYISNNIWRFRQILVAFSEYLYFNLAEISLIDHDGPYFGVDF